MMEDAIAIGSSIIKMISYFRVERALTWLENNNYANPILKWNTASWGEIPADFGRK